MTDMASLPLQPKAADSGKISSNSVAGSVKSALGVANTAASEEIESSEATFVDFLQGLLQPATAAPGTGKLTEGGNALPLAGQLPAQAAAIGQSLQAQLTEVDDSQLALSAGVMPGQTQSGQQLLAPADTVQTASALSAEAISKSIAASMKPASGLKTDPAPIRLPAAASTNNTPALEPSDLQIESLPQLRTSTATAAAFMELSAGRQVLDTVVPTATSPVADSINASLLRSPLPQTGMSADPALQAAAPTITESFGRPEWNQGLGRQIMWMVNQNMQSAEIRLNPAHLGPIEVRIEMDDEQVNVAFSSRHAAVREAVEMALPRLREMFESSGINLADANISQHSFAEQRENQLREEAGNSARFHTAGVAEDSTDPVETHTTQVSSTNSMIDYYI